MTISKAELDKEYAITTFGPLESDPSGKNQHEAGAKLDAGKNRLGLVLLNFPRALNEVGVVGTYGAEKYTDNGWLKVANGEARYTDAMFRHLLAAKIEGDVDVDTGLLHRAQVAWNALAALELYLIDLEMDVKEAMR